MADGPKDSPTNEVCARVDERRFLRAHALMNPGIGEAQGFVFVGVATGSVVVGAVLAAIAVLVFALWRRSAGAAEASLAVAAGPRTDSHAVGPAERAVRAQPQIAAAVVRQTAPVPDAPEHEPVPTAERPPATREPHPSGLGAAELAAIVEDGLSSLRVDLDELAGLVDAVASTSAVPEDLPARPATQQVALIDQLSAIVAPDLDRAHRLASDVADDVERGDGARAIVHGELARVGLPTHFFVTMDATAADLAVDLVRTRTAVERLVRRFEALSSLYSSVRPTLDALAELHGTIDRAVAVADSWRQATGPIDLVDRAALPHPLPG